MRAVPCAARRSMANENDKRLEQRVVAAAEPALAERKLVTAIDVFLGLGWLPASAEQAWRKGRIPYLEAAVTANLDKISKAMRFFRRWAQRRALKPSETAYVRPLPGRPALRFSKSGNPSIEPAERIGSHRSCRSASASGWPNARAARPTSS